MTKKRKAPPLEEVLERPWCYYCERDFDDLKILISHQKAKHLKCSLCPRRLGTAGGLGVHMQQVHKETLTAIENTVPGREDPNIEIFGMEGIPQDVLQAHNEQVTHMFYARGGKAGQSQSNDGQASKKAKTVESAEDIKKRLAEFKAKKAAGQLEGGSGPATPVTQTLTPQNAQVESQFQLPNVNSPSVFNPPFGQPPVGNPPGHFIHPFAQPPGPFPPQFSPPMPPYNMPGPSQGYPPFHGSPPPGPMPQYPVQHFSQPPFPGPPNGYGRPMPHNGPPSGHPPHHVPPQHQERRNDPQRSAPPRQNGLPAAPGLPARPTFDAPPVSRHQMHELHQGHRVQETKGNSEASALSSGIDDLIAQQKAVLVNGNGNGNTNSDTNDTPERRTLSPKHGQDRPQGLQTPEQSLKADTPEVKARTPEKSNDSKSAKAKKRLNLVVKDYETSPEEKMARMSRYAFTPRKPDTYRAPPEGAAARPARGYSDAAESIHGNNMRGSELRLTALIYPTFAQQPEHDEHAHRSGA